MGGVVVHHIVEKKLDDQWVLLWCHGGGGGRGGQRRQTLAEMLITRLLFFSVLLRKSFAVHLKGEPRRGWGGGVVEVIVCGATAALHCFVRGTILQQYFVAGGKCATVGLFVCNSSSPWSRLPVEMR